MNQHQLSSIFGKFAGKEVPLIEREYEIGSQPKKIKQWEPVNINDPTISEMRKTAADNGLVLRLFWPGMGGDNFYRTDRVNAWLEKGKDDKWRVANKFTIG